MSTSKSCDFLFVYFTFAKNVIESLSVVCLYIAFGIIYIMHAKDPF